MLATTDDLPGEGARAVVDVAADGTGDVPLVEGANCMFAVKYGLAPREVLVLFRIPSLD